MSAISAGLFAVAALSLAMSAGAEPLRLRADALVESRAPAGLVVLDAADRARPWLDVQALVWAGGRGELTTPREWAGFSGHSNADIMVLAMRLRAPHGWGEFRAGRFVLATGAIRPVHVDGVSLIARTPSGLTIEGASGSPVLPQSAPRAQDWVAAGRVAQSISGATLGVSCWINSTRQGLVTEEVGSDLAAVPLRWLDVAAKGSYDFISKGIVEGIASAAVRAEPWRVEVFASHRSPSRLVPATSLFSVLGDFPSQALGTTLRWNIAPRLDGRATFAGQSVGHEFGGYGSASGTLRLDDRGAGSVGMEVSRHDVWITRWSGIKLVAFESFGPHLRVSTELEWAQIEKTNGPTARQWGLLALAWRSRTGFEIAGAVEAATTPQSRSEVNGLVRLAGAFEAR